MEQVGAATGGFRPTRVYLKIRDYQLQPIVSLHMLSQRLAQSSFPRWIAEGATHTIALLEQLQQAVLGDIAGCARDKDGFGGWHDG
jgi:hypothetical protein